MEPNRHSDKTEFINRFNVGTKRESVGMDVDIADEPKPGKLSFYSRTTPALAA
jgi:hypothetical protein